MPRNAPLFVHTALRAQLLLPVRTGSTGDCVPLPSLPCGGSRRGRGHADAQPSPASWWAPSKAAMPRPPRQRDSSGRSSCGPALTGRSSSTSSRPRVNRCSRSSRSCRSKGASFEWWSRGPFGATMSRSASMRRRRARNACLGSSTPPPTSCSQSSQSWCPRSSMSGARGASSWARSSRSQLGPASSSASLRCGCG